ncbi:cystatin-A2-like [Dermacentor variabilis]|uniref:cystatin-A2-like n=1 Tax=Dermacentor variabilis TaxID=34621 RepID=UPI003F5C00DF
MASPRVGGLSQELKPADAQVQEVCEKVRSDVENKLGQNFEEFTPVNYRTQVVNGTNYFVKVRVGSDQYVHVRAYKSFQGDVTFAAVQENKSLEDEVEHFA